MINESCRCAIRLVRVSHWTPEDVINEQELSERARGITPDVVLEHEFGEIVNILPFATKSAPHAAKTS